MSYELQITNNDCGDFDGIRIEKCKNKDEIIRLLSQYINEKLLDEVLIDGKDGMNFKQWWN